MLGNMLVNGVVGKTREGVDHLIDVHFHFGQIERSRNLEYLACDRVEFTFRPKLSSSRSITNASFLRGAHSLEKAVPILTLRKRAGEAPWPVPIVCIGWPLPQFGVPHNTQ